MPRRRSSVSADHIEIICQLKLYEVWKRYQCYKKKKAINHELSDLQSKKGHEIKLCKCISFEDFTSFSFGI